MVCYLRLQFLIFHQWLTFCVTMLGHSILLSKCLQKIVVITFFVIVVHLVPTRVNCAVLVFACISINLWRLFADLISRDCAKIVVLVVGLNCMFIC